MSTEAANLPVSICLASLSLVQKMKSFLRLIVLHQQKHGRGRTLTHQRTKHQAGRFALKLPEDMQENLQLPCK